MLYGKCDRVTPMIISDSILTDWEILLAGLMKWVAMMEKFSRQETVTLSRTWKQLPVNSQQKVGAFSHTIAKNGFQNTKVLWARKYILLHLSLQMTIQLGYYFHCNLVRTQAPCENTSKVPSQARLRNLTCRNYEIRNIYCFKLNLW